FPRPVPPPNLHSFPTRRSSDLLPAEMIRDTALAASGLLNDDIGGPSVLPYQPGGLWEEMAFGEGFSAQSYAQSHGKDLYRRGMRSKSTRLNSSHVSISYAVFCL